VEVRVPRKQTDTKYFFKSGRKNELGCIGRVAAVVCVINRLDIEQEH
jgi:hypothetical protein